jgi:hypothetical protein
VTLDNTVGNTESITGLSAPITFSNTVVSQVTLNLGPATSTVNVNAIGTDTLISNSGNATVFVGTGTLAGIQAGLILENENAKDTIFIDDSEDSASQTFRMDTTPGVGDETGHTIGQLTGTALTANIIWDCADTGGVTLFGGSLGNTFHIFGTGAPTTVFGGGGVNTFDVTAVTNSLGTDFVGQLTLHGGDNAGTTLTMDDGLNSNLETYTFAVSQAGTGTMTVASNPSFNLAFDGMNGFVDILTSSGGGIVNDASHTVEVNILHQ